MNDIQFNRLLKNTNEALRTYIKKKNYNQEQLAEKLNRSQGSLSAAINGKSRKGIVRIAEFLIKEGHVNRSQLYDDIPEISSDFELSVWNKLNEIEDIAKENRYLAKEERGIVKEIFNLITAFMEDYETTIGELKGIKPKE